MSVDTTQSFDFRLNFCYVVLKPVQYRLNDDDQACLRDLQTTDPRIDKSRIERVKGGLLKDAYGWVLDNNDFKEWRNDPDSRLLWIKGNPGKGKTMLLCGIINELNNSLSDDTAVTFFFCQAADARINNAVAVLRGLIYLLINKQPSLILHLRKQYNQTGKELFEGVNSWETLSKNLADILDDPLLPETYIIIDALDECTKDLPLLLDLVIQKLSTHPRVKLIVSSRNWPEIEGRLHIVTQKTRLWLELNEKSITEAVNLYIQHKVQKLTDLKAYTDEIRDAVYNHLLLNAHGTFLWVALVCEELTSLDVSKWDAEDIMTHFPPGLNELYQRMITQMGCSRNAKLYSHILAIASVVYRPMTLEEFQSFIDLPGRRPKNIDYLAESVQRCGSFLTLREKTVFFVHQSAKDFLFDKAPEMIFSRGIEAEHYTVFSRSLEEMSRTLQRDIYNIQSHGLPISQVKIPDPDPLAAVRYSCVYWIHHLHACLSSQTTNWQHVLHNEGMVEIFLQKKYLYWLEALALLGGVSEGVLAISQLADLTQVSHEILLFAAVFLRLSEIRGPNIAIENIRKIPEIAKPHLGRTPIYSLLQRGNRAMPSTNIHFCTHFQPSLQPHTRLV